ncbi:hypothetical protein TWF694_011083 [Orbilia ellipsospora]|uniref:DUF7605 domain-containing protein n=1 Tax=Orbilia ellipsospora TaxID=2528407 RepID=A0AAV9X7Z7_9PEZI
MDDRQPYIYRTPSKRRRATSRSPRDYGSPTKHPLSGSNAIPVSEKRSMVDRSGRLIEPKYRRHSELVLPVKRKRSKDSLYPASTSPFSPKIPSEREVVLSSYGPNDEAYPPPTQSPRAPTSPNFDTGYSRSIESGKQSSKAHVQYQFQFAIDSSPLDALTKLSKKATEGNSIADLELELDSPLTNLCISESSLSLPLSDHMLTEGTPQSNEQLDFLNLRTEEAFRDSLDSSLSSASSNTNFKTTSTLIAREYLRNKVNELRKLHQKFMPPVNTIHQGHPIEYNALGDYLLTAVNCLNPPSNQYEALISFVSKRESGKSTLLNALLDVNDLIPTGDDRICGRVILEFAKAVRDHPKYSIEVHFISQAEFKEEAKMLWTELDSNPADPKNRWQEANSRKGKAAFNRFNLLFPGRRFRSLIELNDAIEDFDRLLESTCRDGFLSFHSNNEIQCAARLRELFANLRSKTLNPEYCMAIKRIRVYLDSDILNSGAILADIPGIDDPLTLSTINQKYMAKVQELVIIIDARILISNPTLESMKRVGYEEMVQIDKRGRATMVVTFADQIDDGEYLEFFKNDSSFIEEFNRLHDGIRGLATHSTVSRQQTKKLEEAWIVEAIKVEQHSPNWAEIEKLEQELQSLCSGKLDIYLESELPNVFFRLFGTSRIQFTTFKPSTFEYLEMRRSGILECHKRDHSSNEAITALREWIGDLTYPRHHRVIVTRLNNLETLLKKLLLWTEVESLAMSEELGVAIYNIFSKDLALFSAVSLLNYWKFMTEIGREYEGDIIAVMEDLVTQSNKVIAESAQIAVEILENTPESYSTVKAICRGNGEIYGSTDWNKDFLEHLATNIKRDWEDACDHTRSIFGQYLDTIQDSLRVLEDKLITQIKREVENTHIFETFESWIRLDLKCLDGITTKRLREEAPQIHYHFRLAARKFLLPDCLQKLMIEIYQKTKDVKGSGARSKIIDRIKRSILDEGIFDKLGDLILQDIANIRQMIQSAFRGVAKEIPDKLNSDLLYLPEVEASAEWPKSTLFMNQILKPVLEEFALRLEDTINNADKLTMRHIQDLRDKGARAFR